MVKYLSFRNSSFALRYFFKKLNGKVTAQHTPLVFLVIYLFFVIVVFLIFLIYLEAQKMDERLLRSFMGIKCSFLQMVIFLVKVLKSKRSLWA